MEWIRDKFKNFSTLSLWMKILTVLAAVLFPVLFVLWVIGKIASYKRGSIADRASGSDEAHEDVVNVALDELVIVDLGLEKGQEKAKIKRLQAEEKVMEEDNGRKKFNDEIDAAADAGSVDTVLFWRDDRRGKDSN